MLHLHTYDVVHRLRKATIVAHQTSASSCYEPLLACTEGKLGKGEKETSVAGNKCGRKQSVAGRTGADPFLCLFLCLFPPLPPPALLLHGCEMIRLSSGSTTTSTSTTSTSLRSRPVDTVLQLQDVHEYIRELLHDEYLQVVTSLIADPKGKNVSCGRVFEWYGWWLT